MKIRKEDIKAVNKEIYATDEHFKSLDDGSWDEQNIRTLTSYKLKGEKIAFGIKVTSLLVFGFSYVDKSTLL